MAVWERLKAGSNSHSGAAGFFHWATYATLRQSQRFHSLVKAAPIQPTRHLCSPDDADVREVQAFLWGLFQSAKTALDALARELNLIYWQLDSEAKFYDPIGEARRISFYMVRQLLLRHPEFGHDEVARLLKLRTTGTAADRSYLALSHLANLSLIGPLLIGPVELRVESPSEPITVSQCRVLMADDFRASHPRYERGFEINETGSEIVGWLEGFIDAVYASVTPRLEQIGC